MAKTQKKSVLTLMRKRGVALVAVLMLSVSLGSYSLPKIFADPANNYITGASATASNNTTYSIKFSWTGKTDDHFDVLIYRGSTLISNTNAGISTRSKTLTGLVCGTTHTLKVRASGPAGYHSPYKDATAVTRCPGAAWVSFTASGNSIVSSWKSTSGFAQNYQYYLKTGGGGYVASTTTATSRTISGSCGTSYSAYLVPYAAGQYGPATSVITAATAACPAPPAPAPPPKPTPAPTKKPTTPSSHPAASPTPATPAPATPENFAAEVTSQKIVSLTWGAAANADHYLLRRSTDNATWQDLTSISGTAYSDETTAFGTTYYYQLQAIGGDGQVSGTVIAQAVTEVFAATSETITSPDKRVQVQVPSNAIEGTHSCSVSSSTKGLNVSPPGQKLVLGPYDLVCVTDDGQVVDSFAQPVKVLVKLGTTAKGYKNITLRTITDGTAWKTQPATYNQKTQQISFSLTGAKTFAAYGVKQKSILGVVLLFLLVLLLLAAALFGYLFWWRRRQTPQHVEEVQQQLSAEQEFRQALAKPDCTHLGEAQQVIPSGTGCNECEAQGTQWNALRICLICGHVGCSDDSDQQHAYKHFQQTGHPIIYDYADARGNNIGWCYIDQTYI